MADKRACGASLHPVFASSANPHLSCQQLSCTTVDHTHVCVSAVSTRDLQKARDGRSSDEESHGRQFGGLAMHPPQE